MNEPERLSIVTFARITSDSAGDIIHSGRSHVSGTSVTCSANRECPLRRGCGYILQLVMKTLHGKSGLPTRPCLSLRLKYTINMLRRRPEIVGEYRRYPGLSLSLSLLVLPFCQFSLQPLIHSTKKTHTQRVRIGMPVPRLPFTFIIVKLVRIRPFREC